MELPLWEEANLHFPWERYLPTRSASDRTTSRPPLGRRQLWLWEVGQSSPQWEQFCNVSPEWPQASARNSETWKGTYSFPNTLKKKKPTITLPEISCHFCRNKNLLHRALAARAKGAWELPHLHGSCSHLPFSLPYTAQASFPAACPWGASG